MKRIYKLLLSVLVLAGLFATAAFASNYDGAAQELKDLGLFRGTDAGFELDRAPTRTEAAVMLVRMLGRESEAETQYAEGTVSHPFTDVPEWAAPYIAWLYENKLTTGISDTVFGSAGQCTAKMYCTFVLRSLGYSDTADGDFTFDEAVAFAEQFGICDSKIGDGTFLRDQAVAISYQALASSLKDSDTSLLEKLVSDGAVSETAASAFIEKVLAYHAYRTAYDKYNSSLAVSVTSSKVLKMQNTETYADYNYSGSYAYKVKVAGNDLQLSWSGSENYGSGITNSYAWIKDGYYYYNNSVEKTKTYLTESLLNQLFSGDTSVIMPALYTLKSAAMTLTAEGTKYVFVFADDFDFFGYVNENLDLGFDGSNLIDISVSNCTLTVLTDSAGKINSFKNEYSCNFKYNNEGHTAPISLDYSDYQRVEATGDAVVLYFPDFSDYQELS